MKKKPRKRISDWIAIYERKKERKNVVKSKNLGSKKW